MDVHDFMVVEWILGTAALIVALLVIFKFGYATYNAIKNIATSDFTPPCYVTPLEDSISE